MPKWIDAEQCIISWRADIMAGAGVDGPSCYNKWVPNKNHKQTKVNTYGSIDNGRLILEGNLPSETKHQMLLQLLRDILGIRSIEDRLHIDLLLWERLDRAPGKTEIPGKTEEEVIMQGAEETEETHTAMEGGIPMLPSDEFVPEREE